MGELSITSKGYARPKSEVTQSTRLKGGIPTIPVQREILYRWTRGEQPRVIARRMSLPTDAINNTIRQAYKGRAA